jgi:hypothetical protein
MQTRIVTRPAIAAMALVIAWTAAPRATIAQQCRRTCEAGETRDVRGCCVPAAKPVRQKPRPARSAQPARSAPKPERPPRPASEASEAKAPANKPSEPSAASLNPPPANSPGESSTARPSSPPASTPGGSPAIKPNTLPSRPGPKSFEELLAEAQNAARAGHHDKARWLCSHALKMRRGDARAVMVCAIAACNVGDTRWAKHYYAMASADQKHAIYDICSAKGVDLLKEEPPVSKSDEVLVSKTDEPPGHRSNEPLAPEIPDATQRPQTGLPPGAAALRNPSTEPPVTTRTEPMAPSRPDTDRPVDVRPGMLEPPRVALAPSAPVVEQEPRRRWPAWMPWAVVGVGAVVTGAGGLMYSKAADEYAEFDRKFTDNCLNIAGCYYDDNPPEFFDHLDRARTLESASRLSLIGGGVTVAVGAALVFMNHSTESERERIMARTFVVPTLDAGVAGLSAAISF